MQEYLESSEFIDWQQPAIVARAARLAQGCTTSEEVVQACFEFVRDEIRHSWDHQLNPVTCKASDVLRFGTGYCYAKSHLLAALLRANAIPAGLCYQRLTITDRPPYCLHGLNAVYLEAHGWYRLDARGNKPGVAAAFCPPREQLAFAIVDPGERTFPDILSAPHEAVIQLLQRYDTVAAVAANLPDLEQL